MDDPIRFAIIGGGWRAEFFLRVARACPERFQVTGVVTRKPERLQRLRALFGVEVYDSAEALLRALRPLFVITSVPRAVNPAMIRLALARELPVLSETPPAGTVEELHALADLVQRGAPVQVAEQYPLQPLHAARLALAHSGKLGTVSQAQVSVAHGYHGLALIRRFLGVGCEDADIWGRSFVSKLVRGPNRAGPPAREEVGDSNQSFGTFDFGGKLGIFDFTGDQYFSFIRGPRLLVRGERGEIVNEEAVWLKDFLTPVRVPFRRHEAGPNGNLEGHFLKGIQAGEDWLYRNPLAPAALTDDETAIGDCLLRMAAFARGGAPFYSLAEGCQDTYLDLMHQKAVATGKPVRTTRQPWAW